MSGELLNENQRRRLSTHLDLLVSDLETLAAAPELRRAGSPYTMVQAAIDAALRAAEGMRAALAVAAALLPEGAS